LCPIATSVGLLIKMSSFLPVAGLKVVAHPDKNKAISKIKEDLKKNLNISLLEIAQILKADYTDKKF